MKLPEFPCNFLDRGRSGAAGLLKLARFSRQQPGANAELRPGGGTAED